MAEHVEDRASSASRQPKVTVTTNQTLASTVTAKQQAASELNGVRKVVKKLFNLGRFESVVTIATLCICLLSSLLLFQLLCPQPEPWTVLDCIYFSFVVITTVGYGDFAPQTYESKLLTILFVHFALIVVSFLISNAIHGFTEACESIMQQEDFRVGVFNHQEAQFRQRRRFWALLFLYCLVLAVGTLYFSMRMPWPQQAHWLVDSLYLTVITVTTVGFGDFSPKHSWDLQLFAILLMLVGIPICVSTFSSLASVVFGEAQATRRLRILQGKFSEEKFEELCAFVEEMRLEGVGNYHQQGQGRISRFEYLVFMLSKNGLCNLENVKAVMTNFEAVDVTKQGFLTIDDVREYERAGLKLTLDQRGNSMVTSERAQQSDGELRVDAPRMRTNTSEQETLRDRLAKAEARIEQLQRRLVCEIAI